MQKGAAGTEDVQAEGGDPPSRDTVWGFLHLVGSCNIAFLVPFTSSP